MLSLDRLRPTVSRQNTTLFLTSALISSAATGAVFGWEVFRGKQRGKGLVEQMRTDATKVRRAARNAADTIDAFTANHSISLRRPILPDQQEESYAFEPVGPLMDDSGYLSATISPFVIMPPDLPSPPYIIQFVQDSRPDGVTVQPEDQAEPTTRRSWLEQLPSRSFDFVKSIPFRLAAWKDERRDLKLLKDVEYHQKRSPMGYNE